MTTADTRSPEPAADAAADIEDTGTFQVLVSYYDAKDFKGDWRWGADCPAVGVATDGRTREEALEMVKDAIQGKLSAYPVGQYPLRSDDAMAEACAEYEAEGWGEYTLDWVTISGPNPYR